MELRLLIQNARALLLKLKLKWVATMNILSMTTAGIKTILSLQPKTSIKEEDHGGVHLQLQGKR